MTARLIDVARRAGVAPSTVSYVLSGKRTISDETRARVERSIEELGFRAHAGARSIRRQSTNVIALVLPFEADGQNDVLMQFVYALLGAARQRGANILTLTAEDGADEINKVVGSAMVDGLIVMELQEHDPRVPLLKSISHPAVLIGTPLDAENLVRVGVDSHAAGRASVEHLHQLGHRHIGYLGHPQRVYDRRVAFALQARDGVFAALRSKGMAPSWSPVELTVTGVETAIDRLLREDPGLTAVVVYNEKMLPAVMERFRQIGRVIPEDLSIVAICPQPSSAQTVPGLSYVSVPVDELAQLAFARLAALIDGEDVPLSSLIEPRLHAGTTSRTVEH